MIHFIQITVNTAFQTTYSLSVLYIKWQSHIYICFHRPTQRKAIAACDRLTIYFHAVLSKDFKFDPKKDRIFIRAGPPIGSWNDNTAELCASRYLLCDREAMKFKYSHNLGTCQVMRWKVIPQFNLRWSLFS